MANIVALANLNRWLNTLETVRDVRQFMERDTPKAGEKPTWPIKLDVPGQAMPGYSEYKAMLQEEFEALLPDLNNRVLTRLRIRENDAKDQIKQAAERL